MDNIILRFFIMDALISVGSLVILLKKWSNDNRTYQIIRIIIVSYVIIFITIPGVLDVKRAVHREYKEFSGVALNSSSVARTSRDYIKIYDNEKKIKIEVIIATPKIKKGNQITVQYLPHTKYAKVIEVEE